MFLKMSEPFKHILTTKITVTGRLLQLLMKCCVKKLKSFYHPSQELSGCVVPFILVIFHTQKNYYYSFWLVLPLHPLTSL